MAKEIEKNVQEAEAPEMVEAEVKVPVKDKVKGFAEKHPKLTKALKGVGLLAGGAILKTVADGVIGNRYSDDQLVEADDVKVNEPVEF